MKTQDPAKPKKSGHGGPRPGFGGPQPGAGRPPNAKPEPVLGKVGVSGARALLEAAVDNPLLDDASRIKAAIKLLDLDNKKDPAIGKKVAQAQEAEALIAKSNRFAPIEPPKQIERPRLVVDNVKRA